MARGGVDRGGRLVDSRDMASSPMRVAIIGNSGAGKSTLARSLAVEHGAFHLDLDPFAWRPGLPPARAPLEEAVGAVQAALEGHERWVIEGCYADLIEALAPALTELVFLDLPAERCQAQAALRPFEPHKYASEEAQRAALPQLQGWIAGYEGRPGPLGRAAHLALFEGFEGARSHRRS